MAVSPHWVRPSFSVHGRKSRRLSGPAAPEQDHQLRAPWWGLRSPRLAPRLPQPEDPGLPLLLSWELGQGVIKNCWAAVSMSPWRPFWTGRWGQGPCTPPQWIPAPGGPPDSLGSTCWGSLCPVFTPGRPLACSWAGAPVGVDEPAGQQLPLPLARGGAMRPCMGRRTRSSSCWSPLPSCSSLPWAVLAQGQPLLTGREAKPLHCAECCPLSCAWSPEPGPVPVLQRGHWRVGEGLSLSSGPCPGHAPVVGPRQK